MPALGAPGGDLHDGALVCAYKAESSDPSIAVLAMVAHEVNDRATAPLRRLVRPTPLHTVGGRYDLRRLIGHGGMAHVFLGWDRLLEREVAIKVLHPERVSDERARERFRREALALARIDSPHVVDVYDWGQDGDVCYLVMRAVLGRSIAALIDEVGALPFGRAVRLGCEVLTGLSAIHAQRLVHRDVTAANVMVDATERAVLIDLGVVLDPRRRKLTPVDCTVGTPPCMAPEQRAGWASAGSDLYQTGLLLLYMLTGADAHTITSPDDLLRRLPRRVGAVLARALALDPAARFASAAELRNALLSSLGDVASLNKDRK